MEKKIAIRVLLADDHPLMMAGFAKAIATQLNVEIVGETSDPVQVIKQYHELRPNVLVLDVRFGEEMSGFDIAKAIIKDEPNANIVFLSQFDQDTIIREGYRIGARAFITKDSDVIHLANAVSHAANGQQFFLPNIMERLSMLAIQGDISPRTLLNDRELEVFKAIARGLSNVEIASELNLSAKTISNVSQTVKDKLGMTRPADLTRLAIRHMLITP